MFLALTSALWTSASAGSAAAQNSEEIPPLVSKFPIDDADPESSIPSPEEAARDPQQMGLLMMEMTQRAERAMQEGKPARAARYFRALTKAAPDRALPFRKACAAHKSAGEIAKAVEMCRTASGLPDATLDDYLNLLGITFEKPGRLTPAELRDIDSTIRRLERDLAAGRVGGRGRNVAMLKCQLAARVGDPERLTACIEELRSLNAEKSQLLPYAWSLAMSQGDLSKAESLKDEAIQAGVPRAKVEVMARDLALARAKREGRVLSAARRWWPAAAVTLVAFAAIVTFQRRRRAASKPRSPA
jgi:hypothetical protein